MAFHVVRNPVDLALPYAEQMVTSGLLDSPNVSQEEKERLAQLEREAVAADMLTQQYVVHSGRSFLIPTDIDPDQEITKVEFNDGLSFSGNLLTYSTVRIGRLGSRAIRALCLMFDNVTLLPYFDKVEDDKLLHTPAFAVQDIDPLPAS